VTVLADAGGHPQRVGGRSVESLRETWILEDGWWTDRPLRRRYWEVVLTGGRLAVVYRDLETGGWFTQGA
jgi:hypothetical protein